MYWVTIIPLLPIFIASKSLNVSRVMYLLCSSIVIFAIASAILGYIIIFDLATIKIGDIEIAPVTISGF